MRVIMSLPTYAEFFTQLTGRQPFPYQAGLAEGPWPDLLDVPTGLGKTAAAVIAWMYRRLRNDSETGRRLVYCLPMRVLVEQTIGEASCWCSAARAVFEATGRETPAVHLIIGGSVDDDWEDEPERDAIIVGTQDMLLSRALNRGYGMSRFKWPVHFAQLSNDCLWVFDETQLMGVAVETSAQLQAFREIFGSCGPAKSIWMSATLSEGQLCTVDHPKPTEGWGIYRLGSADRQDSVVTMRTKAAKALQRSSLALTRETEEAYAEEVAANVSSLHRRHGGLTLVIVNRVQRAQAIFTALRDGHENCLLVHARFRSAERAALNVRLREMTDGIVVATQAIEAGVDISAKTLVTELAPWSSLVQRFGRCNRRGETSDSTVHWIDLRSDDKDKGGLLLPYDDQELAAARAQLEKLGDVGPDSLGDVLVPVPERIRPVLRRRDLIDLFDTTADLCGADLDVSRFIRDDRQSDVQFYWRAFDVEPDESMPSPHRDELCAASLASAAAFVSTLRKKVDARAQKNAHERRRAHHLYPRRWDSLNGVWEPVRAVRPGDLVLLHVEAGGYDAALGFTGVVLPSKPVPVIERHAGPVEAFDSDPDAAIDRWVALTAHLGHVEFEAESVVRRLGLQSTYCEAVTMAARWHDLGKAHEQFQARLLRPVADRPDLAPPVPDCVWAKSSHQLRARGVRPAFRHELASALAWLQHAREHEHVDLVAFLIAAHHGKVRMSIRSIPAEHRPPEPERMFARGVWHEDELPATCLPGGESIGPLALDLTPMRIGHGSWLERMAKLRDAPDLGPFRLAYLEALVRIADWRASHNEKHGRYDG
jgi:CRISPR-associated endonuclease/helicase Cas3